MKYIYEIDIKYQAFKIIKDFRVIDETFRKGVEYIIISPPEQIIFMFQEEIRSVLISRLQDKTKIHLSNYLKNLKKDDKTYITEIFP